jgi:hypothetical protein
MIVLRVLLGFFIYSAFCSLFYIAKSRKMKKSQVGFYESLTSQFKDSFASQQSIYKNLTQRLP